MKIIDIILDSALLLGLTDEVEILRTVTSENEEEIIEANAKIESLFHLIKYSIRELCTNYVPMINKRTITISNHEFPVSDLENYIRVNKVMKNGEVIKHKLINRNIVMEEDGEYELEYSTYPEILSMMQEIDFLQEVTSDVLTFGLCSYFSIAHGMFSEFEEFHEQYATKAENLKVLKIFNLPSRRWE